MASFANDTETLLTLNKTSEQDDKMSRVCILKTMENLMQNMQQLQRMISLQLSTSNSDPFLSDLPRKSQNAAGLLKEVQDAMQSTIAKFSATEEIFKTNTNKNECIETTDKCEGNIKAEPTNLTISEKWRVYTELVQQKNESSKNYCLAKMNLGQELGLTFKETRREMMIGLWSHRLCTILYLKEHNDMEELLNDIEEFEKIEKARSDIFKKYRGKVYK